MKIVLGVVDIPYANDSPPQRVTARKGKPVKPAAVSHMTTGEVAQILENRYGVMQTFVDSRADFIRDAVADSLRGALGTVLAGGPLPESPLEEACDSLKQEFSTFLDTEEIAGMGVQGVPTKAALNGVNPRFKGRRGPRRPSFVASGTYERCFKAWQG